MYFVWIKKKEVREDFYCPFLKGEREPREEEEEREDGNEKEKCG